MGSLLWVAQEAPGVHKLTQEYRAVAERKCVEMCERFNQKIAAETDRSEPHGQPNSGRLQDVASKTAMIRSLKVNLPPYCATRIAVGQA
jgi:hypothetical protein